MTAALQTDFMHTSGGGDENTTRVRAVARPYWLLRKITISAAMMAASTANAIFQAL